MQCSSSSPTCVLLIYRRSFLLAGETQRLAGASCRTRTLKGRPSVWAIGSSTERKRKEKQTLRMLTLTFARLHPNIVAAQQSSVEIKSTPARGNEGARGHDQTGHLAEGRGVLRGG